MVILLKKIVQSLGESWDCLDREWQLTAAILTHYGGVPAQGDSIPKLWQKIRIALGDTSCRCGDSAWDSVRRVLELISPTTSFDANDSIYRLLWKLLEALQTPTPDPCDDMNDWGGLSGPIECFEDWGLFAGPITEFEDWGSV